MKSLTSLSTKFVCMSLDQPTCATVHLLQIDRTLIFSWDMGNIQPIKKKCYSRQKMLTNLYSSFETEAWGSSQMATKKICFPINKLTLFKQLYLIFTTISIAIIIRSSIIIIKHILVHKLRCVKVVINF